MSSKIETDLDIAIDILNKDSNDERDIDRLDMTCFELDILGKNRGARVVESLLNTTKTNIKENTLLGKLWREIHHKYENDRLSEDDVDLLGILSSYAYDLHHNH